jgi:hypothetical protein
METITITVESKVPVKETRSDASRAEFLSLYGPGQSKPPLSPLTHEFRTKIGGLGFTLINPRRLCRVPGQNCHFARGATASAYERIGTY